MTALRTMRRRVLGISEAEVSFERRGFSGGEREREYLEGIGRTFLRGYHAALEDERPGPLCARLETEPERARGFCYEGAAMSLAILDVVAPWSRRLGAYLAGPGSAHVYMVHVGAGWAFGRLRFGRRRVLDQLDPLLRWLAFDGYGFHEGYFHWPASIGEQRIPRRLSGYARRAFTQGLGRSLWFVMGMNVERIASTIAAFAGERRADLWSGIGLACTYAGGVDREALERLLELAAGFEAQLAQGAAFAAKARLRAGNPTDDAELACRIICRSPAAEAAEVTDTELAAVEVVNSPEPPDEPRFERWRQRIQHRLDPARPAARMAM